MGKKKIGVKLIFILILVFFTFNLVYPKFLNQYLGLNFPEIPFKLGLDLVGGSRLIYETDLSKVEKTKTEALSGLRDVIEKRVNILGVREPIVRIQEIGGSARLMVELAGIKNVEEAIKAIGETPLLEFREIEVKDLNAPLRSAINPSDLKPTSLTGQYLKKASLDFDNETLEPIVILEFDKEGKELFKQITSRNVDKPLAIFIDNNLISSPVVREPISSGRAQITGNFTPEEAKKLVNSLNAGALPVPIKLISQETIAPSLGKISLEKSLKAGFFGLLGIILFMICYYQMAGLAASLSLLVYGLILLSLFKLFSITLTLAGIAGAILSIGMAVDANVLIFARMKEEIKKGDSFSRAIDIGFKRAWPSIRDGNLTTLIEAMIMFFLGTSFIQGFALTTSLGILVSMFSAIFITQTFLEIFIGSKVRKQDK